MCPLVHLALWPLILQHETCSKFTQCCTVSSHTLLTGVALTCQVKQNLIKFSLFSVLFNFVFQTSSIKE